MNYDNRNRGQLWGVQKTETADPRSADFTGNMNAVCPHCSQSADFFVDGWKADPHAALERRDLPAVAASRMPKPFTPHEAGKDNQWLMTNEHFWIASLR